MAEHRFDTLTRVWAAPRGRRGVLKAMTGGALVAMLGARGPREAEARRCRRLGQRCDRDEDRCCGAGSCRQSQCRCRRRQTPCGQRRCCSRDQVCEAGTCVCPSGTRSCGGGTCVSVINGCCGESDCSASFGANGVCQRGRCQCPDGQTFCGFFGCVENCAQSG